MPALAQLRLLPVSREGVWRAGPCRVRGSSLAPGRGSGQVPHLAHCRLGGQPEMRGDQPLAPRRGSPAVGLGTRGRTRGGLQAHQPPPRSAFSGPRRKKGAGGHLLHHLASPAPCSVPLGPWSGGGKGLSAKPASPPPGSEISLGNRKSLSNSAACLFCSLNRAPLSWAVGNNLPQELATSGALGMN